MSPVILHISYDLRDRLNREKTTAVLNLINVSRNFSEVKIIDLLRVNNFEEEGLDLVSKDHFKINIFGLPYGLFLKWHLERAFNIIKRTIELFNIKLNNLTIIHSHKISFEGYIGYKIAFQNNLPLFLTLRQTDIKVLKMKPNLLPLYKKVLNYSSLIFYLNPHSLLEFKSILGASFYNESVKSKLELLPNIIDLNAVLDSNVKFNENEFLTILRMTKESVNRKNLKRLLVAFSLLENKNLILNIIGDGAYRYKVEKWIYNLGLQNRINLIGNIKHTEIQNYYLKSSAFLLPSLSESFGMVYAESLLCNTPILYSKGRMGFDGFFEDVGVGVDALSPNSIKEGIITLINNNNYFRQNIKSLNQKNAFKIFSSSYIEEKYYSLIKRFIKL